jgi:hypothetical protein
MTTSRDEQAVPEVDERTFAEAETYRRLQVVEGMLSTLLNEVTQLRSELAPDCYGTHFGGVCVLSNRHKGEHVDRHGDRWVDD